MKLNKEDTNRLGQESFVKMQEIKREVITSTKAELAKATEELEELQSLQDRKKGEVQALKWHIEKLQHDIDYLEYMRDGLSHVQTTLSEEEIEPATDGAKEKTSLRIAPGPSAQCKNEICDLRVFKTEDAIEIVEKYHLKSPLKLRATTDGILRRLIAANRIERTRRGHYKTKPITTWLEEKYKSSPENKVKKTEQGWKYGPVKTPIRHFISDPKYSFTIYQEALDEICLRFANNPFSPKDIDSIIQPYHTTVKRLNSIKTLYIDRLLKDKKIRKVSHGKYVVVPAVSKFCKKCGTILKNGVCPKCSTGAEKSLSLMRICGYDNGKSDRKFNRKIKPEILYVLKGIKPLTQHFTVYEFAGMVKRAGYKMNINVIRATLHYLHSKEIVFRNDSHRPYVYSSLVRIDKIKVEKNGSISLTYENMMK